MTIDQPRFDLADRVVMITGAARGIGRACAEVCAGAGARIALGLRNVSSGDQLVAELRNRGSEVLPVEMDVLDLSQITGAAERVRAHFGRVDVLINNVGLGPENAAENVTEADYDLTMDANVKGTFFTCQAFGRIMIAQGGGCIVNISSQAGTNVLMDESVYCASKAAVDHLTRCLALEWAKHRINVNAVAPTFIWTDATRPSLEQPAYHDRVLAHIPLGRIGNPVDVASAVLFLASPAASLITGTVLNVDGGWSVA